MSSPFILNAVVKSHLERHPSPVTKDLLENIYVDNVVSGTEIDQEAINYYQEAIQVLDSAGFKLRSWSTNSRRLHDATANDNHEVSEWWFNAVSATKAIFTVRTC